MCIFVALAGAVVFSHCMGTVSSLIAQALSLPLSLIHTHTYIYTKTHTNTHTHWRRRLLAPPHRADTAIPPSVWSNVQSHVCTAHRMVQREFQREGPSVWFSVWPVGGGQGTPAPAPHAPPATGAAPPHPLTRGISAGRAGDGRRAPCHGPAWPRALPRLMPPPPPRRRPAPPGAHRCKGRTSGTRTGCGACSTTLPSAASPSKCVRCPPPPTHIIHACARAHAISC